MTQKGLLQQDILVIILMRLYISYNKMFGHCHIYTRHRHPYFEKKKKKIICHPLPICCVSSNCIHRLVSCFVI
jgi:hypothetical protein